MFHPSKGNLDSRIFCYWNTKSSNFIGFGIRNTAQGILNPTDDKNRAESSTSSPQSKVWNHKFKTVSDSLTWGEIFILYLFIHLVSSPLCCEHHLLEVNTTCQINATSIFFVLFDRQTLLSINAPANENLPHWFLYRLTRGVSTHWRATCSYDKYGINNYKDYILGKFAAADIFAFLGSGVSHPKKFFRPFGPQFGLKIRGRAPPLDSPLRDQ